MLSEQAKSVASELAGGTKEIVTTSCSGRVITPEMIEFAAQRKLARPLKTVFDIDDVAWDLSGTVAKKVGVNYEDLIDFHILQNERLAMEKRLAINDCYRQMETFQNMQFYPGFDQVMDLQKIGALIQMNSNSFSVEVRDSKISQIFAAAPGVWYDHLRFNVVDEKTTLKKRFDDDTYILVDDSPYNVAISPATWNIMPCVPWNQTTKARAVVRGKTVIYVPAGDFRTIIRLVANLLHPGITSLENCA